MKLTYDGVIRRHLHSQVNMDWTAKAACVTADPETFFPVYAERYSQVIKAAKAICAGCPVRLQCLQYAVGIDERFGIYGGLTEREREKLTGKKRDWLNR